MEIPSARLQKRLIGPCIICGAEGFEGKFRRFTEDAYQKDLQHGTLNSTWILNVTQFCNSHYMSYIVNGINTEKSVKTSESTISLKRRQRERKMKPSEMSDDERISEINFIECVRSMAHIFYAREKKERKPPIYDWKLLRMDLESEDIHLKSFLNLLEKLINSNDRDLVDHTISQRQKGLSFLCHFLAGIGNKHINALKKDIAIFLDHSGTSDQAIDTLSNMQLSSTSRENRRGKNIISSIHRDNVTRELVKYQANALIANIDDYHNIHGLHIPTTTSTSTVAHMTTVLAILISTAKNQFMALLSQSFNDRFARKPAYAENDLLDNLTLNLHSTEAYIKAMETFASFPEFHKYFQHNVIPLVADWPGQILPRKVITMQQQQARKNIQTETDTPEQLSRTACIINCLHHDNVFQNTFVSTTKYPYCKEDLIGLTNKASIFLLELFADIKNNTGKSEWTKRDKNKVSCHLATLNIDINQRHLPMAFSSEYPPITDMSIGEDDFEVDLNQEKEVQSTDNDNGVEDLSKQPLFNLKTSN
ncbi:140_t:CDS:2 [Ambispora gerdemannii]|uniref:140_t:CDS:1 n=1 Tax=Ambispora gerdemannii TaxID=144530 RepID=A0A9N9GQM0_9GLOM|nr:140_t:CDS:2 [Ambispora gerdemannii]